MSATLKPFYRFTSTATPGFNLNLSSDGTTLEIMRYGQTGKDFFAYNTSLKLSDVEKNTRYTVVASDNSMLVTNFDSEGKLYDHAFVNKLFYLTLCRPYDEIVIWRTDADEYFILCRYVPNSNLEFTHSQTNFSKIVKANSSLGDEAYSTYMTVADKLDRRMWLRDAIHPEDRLDYIDVQSDITTKVLKALLDQNPELKASVVDTVTNELSLMDVAVSGANYALQDTSSVSAALEEFTDVKTMVRSTQASYQNSGIYPYALHSSWDDAIWDNPNKIVM